MAFIAPVPDDELGELESELRAMEDSLGMVPNSLRTMARRPELVRAHVGLSKAVLNSGSVPRGLKHLIALVASGAAGCRYCEAHNVSLAGRYGIAAEKLDAVWEYERDDRFDASERAALNLARDAAQVPNLTTEAHFVALKEHFTDDEIVEIVAVIAFFGWLNRWNDTMATTLEDQPLQEARRHLALQGWDVGKHAHDAEKDQS